jgi:hypothetical protein
MPDVAFTMREPQAGPTRGCQELKKDVIPHSATTGVGCLGLCRINDAQIVAIAAFRHLQSFHGGRR